MRRLAWIAIIIILGVIWFTYTFIDPVQAAFNNAAMRIGTVVGGALGSFYMSIVTSPFWQANIAPWDWLISGIIFSVVTMIVFWKAPKFQFWQKKPSISTKDMVVQREPAEPESSPSLGSSTAEMEKTEGTTE